jgi:gluconolactonase
MKYWAWMNYDNLNMINKIICLLFLGTSFMSCKVLKPSVEPLFVQDELKLISADFSFTEGCSPDKAGNVYFTDQPNDKIWKYNTDGKLSVFLEKSGRANGTYFDQEGNLVTCADAKGELWSIDPSGKVKVLLDNFNGKQLNGPNDLWIDLKGGIYLTDPYYQRPYWTRKSPALQSEDVYYLPKGSKIAKVVANSFERPNGIVGTPDGKFLYIADIAAQKLYKYAIAKDGSLTDKQLLINRGSDGMTLDDKGNIYLTGGDGVYIYTSKGAYISTIAVPKGPSNVCFSGKENNILFITAKNAIYTLPMKVKGVE